MLDVAHGSGEWFGPTVREYASRTVAHPHRSVAVTTATTRQQMAAAVEGRLRDAIGRLPRTVISGDFHVRSWLSSGMSYGTAVAIPARNEGREIDMTLRYLADAIAASANRCVVVVFANDCVDETHAVVEAASRSYGAEVVLLVGSLSPPFAQAGWARRIAMDAACSLLGPSGIILSTDADTRVSSNWIGEYSEKLGPEHDLMCGALRLPLPADVMTLPSVRRLLDVEGAYSALQDHVRYRCDQVVGRQPLFGAKPHYTEAGASIGITKACYERIGGLPPVCSSEDRALVRRAELLGERVGYADVSVETSGRLVGRARGGLADTLVRWMTSRDPVADQRVRDLAGIKSMWRNSLVARTSTLAEDVGRLSSTGSTIDKSACGQRPSLAGIRFASVENEWSRSLSRRRLVATELEFEVEKLKEYVFEHVEPVFETWRGHLQ